MNEYRTSDIILAAVIRLDGYPLKTIELQGNKGTFVFEGVDECVIQSYDFGQCSVEPVAFNGMIKQLTTSVRRMTQR